MFVKSVTFQSSSTTHLDTIFPFIDDPFLPPPTVSPSDPTRPAPPPTPALRELPTCPVCLERMDASVTGLLTILCQHTFHCQCLTKWGDGHLLIVSRQPDQPGDEGAHRHGYDRAALDRNLWNIWNEREGHSVAQLASCNGDRLELDARHDGNIVVGFEEV